MAVDDPKYEHSCNLHVWIRHIFQMLLAHVAWRAHPMNGGQMWRLRTRYARPALFLTETHLAPHTPRPPPSLFLWETHLARATRKSGCDYSTLTPPLESYGDGGSASGRSLWGSKYEFAWLTSRRYVINFVLESERETRSLGVLWAHSFCRHPYD